MYRDGPSYSDGIGSDLPPLRLPRTLTAIAVREGGFHTALHCIHSIPYISLNNPTGFSNNERLLTEPPFYNITM
jgi:hypothetical protein